MEMDSQKRGVVEGEEPEADMDGSASEENESREDVHSHDGQVDYSQDESKKPLSFSNVLHRNPVDVQET